MSSASSQKKTSEMTLKPKPFEVALCRKIKAQRKPLLQTFYAIDEDNDGIVTKTDMKNGLNNLFNIDLDNEQIDIIFLRFASLNNSNVAQSQTRKEGMRFQGFARYVTDTADSATMSSSLCYGSVGMSAGKHVKSLQSVEARTKDIRRLVYGLIQQNAQSASDGGMAATSIFLSMDCRRDNQVSKEEFRLWLNSRRGSNFSEEEMKLLLGNFWKDKSEFAFSFQECVKFVEFLARECSNNSFEKEHREEELQDQTFKSADEIIGRDGNDDSDGGKEEMQRCLEGNLKLSKENAEIIQKFREALNIKTHSLNNLFKTIEKKNTRYLTRFELKVAMEKCEVSPLHLLHYFSLK